MVMLSAFNPAFAVTVPLNVAFPASDISSVRAVKPDPPSLPSKTKSASDTKVLKTVFVDASFISITNSCWLPSSKRTSPPAALSITSPATSSVKSPELKSISVPSIVILSTVSAPALSVPATSPLPDISSVAASISPVIVKFDVPVPSALANGNPPACDPLCTTNVSLSVSTVTSRSAPVN